MVTKTPVRISSISYVIIYVKDTEKALPFYRDTLGLKVKSAEPGWVELDTGEATLALHGDEHAAEKRTGSHPTVVFQAADIYATYEALKSHGIKVEKEPQTVCETGDHIGKSVEFHDHDGNKLSVFGMVPKKNA